MLHLGADVKIHRAQGSTELHIEGEAVLTTNSDRGGGGCDNPFASRAENEARRLHGRKYCDLLGDLFLRLFFEMQLAAAMRADCLVWLWNMSGIPGFVNSGLRFIEEHGHKEQEIFSIGYMSYTIDDVIRKIETGQSFVEDFDSVHMMANV